MKDTNPKEIPDMFSGSMTRLLIKLSTPMLTGMVVQLLYNVADTYFISLIDRSDPSYTGGTGIVFPLLFLAMSIASGIMTGVGSVVARAIGEKNEAALSKAADSAMAMGIITACAILIGGMILANPLVNILGAKGDYYTHALTYFKYMLPFMALMIAVHSIAGIFQGEGKMKHIMIAMIIGTISNVILDPIFIFALDLKVRGAALASVAGQLLGFIYILYALGSKNNTFRIKWSISNINFKLIKNITVIGFPMTLAQIAMALSMIFYNRILINIDKEAMTAFTLVGRFDQAVLMPVFALSSALISVVGQNAGRKNFHRIRDAWKTSIILGSAVVFFLALFHILIAPSLYSTFSNVPGVVNYCILQTRILELSFLFGVIGIIGRSVFQAIGYPLPGLVLTIIRTLAIGLPLAFLFCDILHMQARGVYLGILCGNLLTACIGLLWITSVLNRLEKGTLRVASVST